MEWVQRSGDTTHFIEWKPFNHPQLGKVELGGWHPLIYANPLVATLGDIVTKTTDFILTHASAAPRLRIRRAEAMPLAKSLYKVTAEVSNGCKAQIAAMPKASHGASPPRAPQTRGRAKACRSNKSRTMALSA